MSQEILHAQIEYESNATGAIAEFERFNSKISKSLSEIGAFETEVTDFGSAMVLAFETPKRGMEEFLSLMKVGFSGVRRGGEDAAIGVTSIALGLRGLSERIPQLNGLANAFDMVASVGNTVGKVFGAVRKNSQGLEADLIRVARIASDTGDQLFFQAKAWQELYRDDIAGMRAVVAELKRKVKEEEGATENTGELEKAERDLAKAQDELNVAVRAGVPQIGRLASNASTARTAIRHMFTAVETGSKMAPQRMADAERSVRLFGQELERARKIGIKVPQDLANTYNDFGKQIKIASNAFKAHEKQTRRSDDATKGHTKSIKGAATAMTAQGVAMSKNATASRVLSTSLSHISPTLSRMTSTVGQFGNIFSQQMDVVGNKAAVAGAKINASMMMAQGGLIALGAAAVALIKKTGMIAAEVTTLEITMRTIARNLATKAGADIEKFVAYVDTIPASLKGITTREALEAVTSFLRGVPQLLPRIQELSEAAKSFGVTVADMSSSQVFGQFNQFIQSGNTMLLKRLNIVTTADQMHKAYAKTIGKSAKDLTAAEKITARFNGILEEVALTSGVYDEAMKSAGKALSSMSRLSEQAALVMGTRFEPILAKIIFTANDLLEWFTELPAPMLDFIANVIKITAAAGSLVGVITIAGPAMRALIPIVKALGLSFKTAFPWMLAIGAAVGAVMLAIKAFKKVWEEDLGGVRTAVLDFKKAWDEAIGPIADDIVYWGKEIKAVFSSIVSLLTEIIIGPLSSLGGAVVSLQDIFSRVFGTIQDVVNGSMMAVSNILWGILHLLRGEFPQASAMFENAIVNALTSVALLFQNTVAKAAVWGWNLIVQFANGITLAATSVLAKVMTWVGNLIGRFWRGRSPPKEGPLRYIVEWGRGIMQTFLGGFKTADFSVLNEAMAPIKTAFQTAVKAGTLAADELAGAVKNVRFAIVQLISDVGRTGQINEGAFKNVTDSLGEGGEELSRYVRLLLEARMATDALKKSQERLTGAEEKEAKLRGELEELVGSRASRRDIRVKRGALSLAEQELATAKASAEGLDEKATAAQEALAVQKEFLAAQQESVNLEIDMIEALKKVADKLSGVAGAMKKLGDALPEEELKLVFPDVPEGEGIDLGLEKLNLGEVSQEFLDMRLKIQGIVDAVQAWFDLPWETKLETIKTAFGTAVASAITWVEGITGWDISAWIEDTREKVREWIRTSFIGGIVSAVQDVIKFIKATAIAGFFTSLVAMMGFSPGVIAKLYPVFVKLFGFFVKVAPKIAGVFKGFSGVVAGAWPMLVSFGETLYLVFLEIGSAIAKAVPWLLLLAAALYGIWSNKDLLIGFWKDFVAEIDSILERLSKTFGTVVSFGSILKWLGTVVGGILTVAFRLFGVVFGSLWRAIQTILPRLQGLFSGVFSVIYGIIKTLLIPVINVLIAAVQALSGDSEGALESLRIAWENFKEGLGLILSGLGEIIENAFFGAIELVGSFVGELVASMVTMVADMLEQWGILDSDTAEALRTWGENALTSITGAIKGFTDGAEAAWKDAFGKDGFFAKLIEEAGEDATTAEKIRAVFKGTWAKFIEFLTTDLPVMAQGVADWFGDLWKKFTEFLTTDLPVMAQKVVDWFKDLWEKFTEFLTTDLPVMAQGVADWFGDLWDTVIEFLGTNIAIIAGKIGSWFADIWGKFIEFLTVGLPGKAKEIADWFGGLIDNWLTSEGVEAETTGKKIGAIFGILFGKFIHFLFMDMPLMVGKLFLWFGSLIMTLIEFLVINVPIYAKKIVDWFESTWEKFIEFLTTDVPILAGKIVDWFESTWDKFIEFLTTDAPILAQKIVDWFGSTWTKFLEFLTTDIPTLAGKIVDWFESTWAKFMEFLTTDMPKYIVAWVNWMADVLEGFLEGILSQFTTGEVDIAKVGAAIVDGIKAGITTGWTGFVTWFKGKLALLSDLLPWSEPEDPTSPLRGLSKAGEAIIHNIADGMQIPDLNNVFTSQLAGMVGQIQVVGNGGSSVDRSRAFNIENLILQGVQNPEDLMSQLQGLSIPGGP